MSGHVGALFWVSALRYIVLLRVAFRFPSAALSSMGSIFAESSTDAHMSRVEYEF
jgi:hypothetical protein